VQWLRGSGFQPMGLRVMGSIHIEVDTGMGRQGVRPGEELEQLLDAIRGAGLVLDGMFTHFCSSEVAGSELTRTQERRFAEAVRQVGRRGLGLGWVHAGNTSYVDTAEGAPWLVDLAAKASARAMVRCGLALYGYCLPVEGGGTAAVRPGVKPVMTWKAHVLAVRELEAGDTVGYNAMFTAKEPMRIALIAAGYADGLRRELSSTNDRPGGWVVIRRRGQADRRAPILGRVSMDLTVVDVTGIADVDAGDAVVLLGDGVTAEDHARLAGTIPYEILCGVNRR
jgi:alanine racemase